MLFQSTSSQSPPSFARPIKHPTAIMHDDRTAELEKGSPPSSRPSSPAEPKPQASGPPAAPEGGTKAYLSLLGGSLGLFISFGWVNCIALFQAEYEINQLKAYSSSEVSWITSSECETLIFFPQPAMKTTTKSSFQSSFLHAVHVTAVWISIRQLWTTIADLYWWIDACVWPHDGQLVKQILPIVLGTVVLLRNRHIAHFHSVNDFGWCDHHSFGIFYRAHFSDKASQPMTYFRKRRALAGGLTVAGSSLGGVIFPLMVNSLLPEVGFAWTMRICAFLILGLWAIAVVTISSNLPHTRKEFNLANYLRPFTEFNFLILLTFCFFLYCEPPARHYVSSVSQNTANQGFKGDCLCLSTTLSCLPCITECQ